MTQPQAEAKPFEGRLTFDGGQVCEVVEGRISEDRDPRHGHASGGRKVYSGKMWCEFTRATIEVLGRRATLHTAGGLKARIELKGVSEDEEGSILEFDTVGSADAGSFDSP